MSVPTERLERPRWPAMLMEVLSDRVVIALGIGLLALMAFDSAQVLPTLAFTGEALLGMAPYLLLAVAIAADAKATGSDKLSARPSPATRSSRWWPRR